MVAVQMAKQNAVDVTCRNAVALQRCQRGCPAIKQKCSVGSTNKISRMVSTLGVEGIPRPQE